MKVNAARVLNAQFACTRCCVPAGWIAMERPELRQYSSIHRLRCKSCGDQVVAKVVGGKYSIDYARAHARKEYEVLRALQSAFPQDERYGTLAPLGHLEYDGHGIVITRLVGGDELARYMRTLDGAGVQAAFRSAGVWLKKLHDSDVKNQKRLETADKISYLVETYGTVLRADPKTGAACELLSKVGPDIDKIPVSAVRQHGDFKPENVLCDGTRYIGLDIQWRHVGAAVYDLAPFLNHLWLKGCAVTAAHRRRLYDLAEAAFLAGYGDRGELRPLRWAQLYFALCYMGDYRRRGRVTASYASWTVWPLVRRLATQLQCAG